VSTSSTPYWITVSATWVTNGSFTLNSACASPADEPWAVFAKLVIILDSEITGIELDAGALWVQYGDVIFHYSTSNHPITGIYVNSGSTWRQIGDFTGTQTAYGSGMLNMARLHRKMSFLY